MTVTPEATDFTSADDEVRLVEIMQDYTGGYLLPANIQVLLRCVKSRDAVILEATQLASDTIFDTAKRTRSDMAKLVEGFASGAEAAAAIRELDIPKTATQ